MARLYMFVVTIVFGIFFWLQWIGWGISDVERLPNPKIRSAPTYSSGYYSGGGYYYTGK